MASNGADDAAPIRNAEAFEALMTNCPDNDALRESLRKVWTKPPTEAMARAWPGAADADEARRLLFFPRDEDGAAYAKIAAPWPASAPSPRPASAARPALGMMRATAREQRLRDATSRGS